MSQAPPKILVIDDDPRIVGVLTITLEDAHFEVITAYNGKDGLRAAYEQHPNLILLDITMPEMNGFEVLKHLRAVTDTPVIFLTSLGDDASHIRGMQLGAADFIVKGSTMDVLLAHIHNRLNAAESRRDNSGARRFDARLKIDVPRHQVWLQDEIVELTPLQWRLLKHLLENEGRTSTYQNLLSAGWDHNDYGGDVSSLKVQISLLRKQLQDSPRDSRYIHTIREEGYLFQVRNH